MCRYVVYKWTFIKDPNGGRRCVDVCTLVLIDFILDWCTTHKDKFQKGKFQKFSMTFIVYTLWKIHGILVYTSP